MALLLERGYQVLPDQTAESFLSRRDRHASSLVTCPFALCTLALEAQVGQEGRGQTDQMPVCHGGPIRAVLVLPQPQQLLRVFQPRLDGMISNDKFCCTRWGTLPLSWWRRPLRLRR
jgi:hypothetical protein